MLTLKWNSYNSTMLKKFDNYLKNQSMVDVMLSCQGKNLHAHKLILSASSKYFEDILGRHGDKQAVLFFHDVNFDHLKILLDFIYKREAKVPKDQLNDVVKLADNLQLEGFTEYNKTDEHLINEGELLVTVKLTNPEESNVTQMQVCNIENEPLPQKIKKQKNKKKERRIKKQKVREEQQVIQEDITDKQENPPGTEKEHDLKAEGAVTVGIEKNDTNMSPLVAKKKEKKKSKEKRRSKKEKKMNNEDTNRKEEKESDAKITKKADDENRVYNTRKRINDQEDVDHSNGLKKARSTSVAETVDTKSLDGKRQRIICPQCKKHFAIQKSLKRHQLYYCSQNPKFKCEICDGLFRTPYDLKVHLLKKHDDYKDKDFDTGTDE